MKGCEECPMSEDVWLEAARLMVIYSIYSIDLQSVKGVIAVRGNPSQSCGASPAVWDHTLLPAT